MDKINNKNAREKALLEEAYGSVYKEDTQKPRITSSRDENGREVFHVLDKHGKSVYKAGSFKVAQHWLREYYDILMAEDEQNPDADTYDAQGKEPAEMVSLNARDEEEQYEYTADDLKDIHDVIERVYEISGYLATEIDHLQVVEDDVPFARWNNLKTLQKDLSNIFDTVATEEDWHRESESRRMGAEPRSGGYGEY